MADTSNRIRWFRKSEGLSLRQLSLRLDPSGDGPTESAISRWERGEINVPDDQKHALADVFGVSIAYLMGWDDEPLHPLERTAA